MKRSQVEGDVLSLSKGWNASTGSARRVERLGDVCEVIAGQSPEGTYYNNEGKGLPFYQGKKEFTEKYIGDPTTWTTKVTKEAQAGDILMSVRAPVGPVNFATQKICIGRGLAAIRANKAIDNEFLFYFLLKHEEEVEGNAGAVFNSINKTQIENIEIPIPPLPEQKRIVAMLDETFAALAQVHANAERNQVNAREVFEAFSKEVFETSKKDWKERKLGDKDIIEIIDNDRGVNYPKKSEFHSEGYCLFMNTKNVRPDGFDFTTKMFITEAKDKKLGKGKLSRNDVVMTTRGTIGNLGVYTNDIPYENIRTNSGMLIFRPNIKQIIPEFLFEVLRSGSIKAQIKKHVSGAAQPQLPIKTLVNFTFHLPKSLAEQRLIVQRLDGLAKETRRLEEVYEKKMEDVEELRKSVLKEAFQT